MGKIILIRYGQTEVSKISKMHFTNDDSLLNTTGVDQITKTAQILKAYSPFKVFASSEKRAIQSGEIISNLLKIPFETVSGMEERNWGSFSGRPWIEIETILKTMSLEDRFSYKPPSGESWQEFEARLIKSLDNIITQHPTETIVVVSHAGAIRALMPYCLGVEKQESFNYNLDNASITVFNYQGKNFSTEIINDTSHL